MEQVMEQVKKFLDEQLNKVDIEQQRQNIQNQSNQVQEQSDRILKLLFEGPDSGFDGANSK